MLVCGCGVAGVFAAYDKNLCTFNFTKRTFVVQRHYTCLTCDLVNNMGVCLTCARTCHAGHRYGLSLCWSRAASTTLVTCRTLSCRVSLCLLVDVSVFLFRCVCSYLHSIGEVRRGRFYCDCGSGGRVIQPRYVIVVQGSARMFELWHDDDSWCFVVCVALAPRKTPVAAASHLRQPRPAVRCACIWSCRVTAMCRVAST